MSVVITIEPLHKLNKYASSTNLNIFIYATVYNPYQKKMYAIVSNT